MGGSLMIRGSPSTSWVTARRFTSHSQGPGKVSSKSLTEKTRSRSGEANSGMGKYHGKWGFDSFTNARGVLYHSPRIDTGVRYPPYSEHQRERAVESWVT